MRTATILVVMLLFTMFQAVIGYAQSPSGDVIAYYPFNGNANDESGNGYHGTVTGATLTEDRFGFPNSAYRFDGDDHILTTLEPVIDPNDNLTISAWIRCDVDCRGVYLLGLERRHHQELTLYVPLGSDGRIIFHFRDDDWNSSVAFSSTNVNDGNWHLITGVRDVTVDQIKIYVDGTFENAVPDISVVSMNASASRRFAIGANNHSFHGFRGPLIGAMDDIRIYNRALTEDEIQALFNQPPTAAAGPDQTVECASSDGTSVTLDGAGSSDPDSDSLSFTWTDENDQQIATGPTPTVVLPLGTHAITLTVDDGDGGSDTDEVVITVEDTISPEIIVLAEPIELWPPNHKYHTIALSEIVTSAADVCDANVSASDVVITSTSSDEPENGQGDGNTTDDIIIAGDCASVDLRAERQGGGNGRVYAIHLAVSDASGHEGAASYQVQVPKSKKSGAVDDGPFYTVIGCGTAPLASVAEAGTTPTVKGKLLEGQRAEIPAAYELAQNYPNPFNPSTEIQFTLPETTSVRLVVYNVMGREVAHLVEGSLGAGTHRVTFDASGLPSGVYLYQITAGSFTRTNRMVLTK